MFKIGSKTGVGGYKKVQNLRKTHVSQSLPDVTLNVNDKKFRSWVKGTLVKIGK